MKILKYKFICATEENPNIEPIFVEKSMTWCEANEEIAKREAYNGEYTIEDDGQPDPVTPKTNDVSWDAMAEAIKEGVNEV